MCCTRGLSASYFRFERRVTFSSTLFGACYCIFSIHPSSSNATTGSTICNISFNIVPRVQVGPHVCICGEMVVGVDARGITARRLRIGLLGRRGRGKKFFVNSFFLHAADFTLLDGDAYVRTRYVRVRFIDLHKAQGLCSVLKRCEFFYRRACRHNCVTYVFGRCSS